MTDVTTLSSHLQTLWTLLCAALVLLMQAGFCCVEAGTVRHKNSINVAVKNLVDLCISFPAFFVVGYALMFGVDHLGLVGTPQLMLAGVDEHEGIAHFVYQAAFCSTAATIVSGGVAERCRFLPYVLVSLSTSVLIYPLFGHSVWGGGLLSQLGFHDFAGSSVVHMLGAGITLAGVQVLGPRKDRFDSDGRPRPVPASSMPLVAVGVVILMFGWVGFNGGSAPLGAETPMIIANTLLAACFGGLGATLVSWAYGGTPKVELILNGFLGGLVAVTACADVVTLAGATLVGLLGGFAVVLSTNLLERLRLDDAVGAVPVHGAAGIVGILATALLSRDAWLHSAFGSRLEALQVQAIGAGACLVWSYLMGLVTWWLVARLTKVRVGPVEESIGMNFSEHEVESPVIALTRGAMAAQTGTPGSELRFDGVSDSQFEGLAQAIRMLAEQNRATATQTDQWSADLEAICGTLDLHRSIGREATERYQGDVYEVDQGLEHIATFIMRGRYDGQALALAENSLVNLRRRLQLLQVKVPACVDSWDEIHRMTARLDRLAASIRGTLHGTH